MLAAGNMEGRIISSSHGGQQNQSSVFNTGRLKMRMQVDHTDFASISAIVAIVAASANRGRACPIVLRPYISDGPFDKSQPSNYN